MIELRQKSADGVVKNMAAVQGLSLRGLKSVALAACVAIIEPSEAGGGGAGCRSPQRQVRSMAVEFTAEQLKRIRRRQSDPAWEAASTEEMATVTEEEEEIFRVENEADWGVERLPMGGESHDDGEEEARMKEADEYVLEDDADYDEP